MAGLAQITVFAPFLRLECAHRVQCAGFSLVGGVAVAVAGWRCAVVCLVGRRLLGLSASVRQPVVRLLLLGGRLRWRLQAAQVGGRRREGHSARRGELARRTQAGFAAWGALSLLAWSARRAGADCTRSLLPVEPDRLGLQVATSCRAALEGLCWPVRHARGARLRPARRRPLACSGRRC